MQNADQIRTVIHSYLVGALSLAATLRGLGRITGTARPGLKFTLPSARTLMFGGLQIAMDAALFVRGFKGLGDLALRWEGRR